MSIDWESRDPFTGRSDPPVCCFFGPHFFPCSLCRKGETLRIRARTSTTLDDRLLLLVVFRCAGVPSIILFRYAGEGDRAHRIDIGSPERRAVRGWAIFQTIVSSKAKETREKKESHHAIGTRPQRELPLLHRLRRALVLQP